LPSWRHRPRYVLCKWNNHAGRVDASALSSANHFVTIFGATCDK
jgi:hypothetical protein